MGGLFETTTQNTGDTNDPGVSPIQVKIVNDIENHPDFLFFPGKETVAYKSVISCPYQMNGITAGVVNIDCEYKDAFKPEKIKFLVQAAADTLALVIQLFDYKLELEKYALSLENKLDEKNKVGLTPGSLVSPVF